MKLAETYSSSCGLQLDNPFLYQKYFPIPFEKYITIQNSSGMSAKNYDFWQEVIDILYPFLEKEGIKIIQLGGKDAQPLNRVLSLVSQTSLHQTAYIASKALLHMGNDSFLAHYSASQGVPLCEIFGSTRPENHGPYLYNKQKTKFIVGDLRGNKPSFSNEESDKVVNRIKPEEIVCSVLDLLGIDKPITRKSLFFGKQYQFHNLDLVPDCLLSPEVFQGILPTIRMDIDFNENYLGANLSHRQFFVLTDKPIDINLLKHFKHNVKTIVYEIKEDFSVEFIENLRKAGIQYILFSLLKNGDLAKAKLAFFDYGIISEAEKRGKLTLEENPQITKDSLYRTNKFLLSKNKIYLNRVRWEEGKFVESFDDNTDVVSLTEEFFDYSDHFYIFNQ